MAMGVNEWIWLFFLTLAGGPVCLSALTVRVPERVTALVGTCVLIPCSFVQPKRPVEVDLRLQYHWSTPMGPLFPTKPRIAFSSSSEGSVTGRGSSVLGFGNRDEVSRVHKDFQGRVSLTGDTSKGDCSVTVDDVRQKDASNYVMEIRRRGDKLWSRKSFRIDVSSLPETPQITGPASVTDGQEVVLNCSVSFPCPSHPPVLRWRWLRGHMGNRSLSVDPQLSLSLDRGAIVWASISFTAFYQRKPQISCEADHQYAASTSVSKDIHVKFPPKEVYIRLHTLSVLEGGSALLECSCKADPPVEEYDWSYTKHGRTHVSPQHSLTLRVNNVTRHTRVTCIARNRLGSTVSPSTAINVEYKPHILSKSSCILDGRQVHCRCRVDSNPRAAVTWSLNGSLPPHSYNVSIQAHGNGTLTATLTGKAETLPVVVCYANNAHGNDSRALLQETHGSPLLWVLLAALCVALSLLTVMATALLCCCRRQSSQHSTVINHRSQTVYPEDVGIYQERAPLYINCTEVTHVYSNGSYQLVYQNCTPRFVRTKQTHKKRRAGWRDRAIRETERPRGREQPRTTVTTPETAIYLEVI